MLFEYLIISMFLFSYNWYSTLLQTFETHAAHY